MTREEHLAWAKALSWRKHQARHLQAKITYLDKEDAQQTEPRRMFVSITAGGGTSYRMMSEVIGSKTLQEAALKGLLRDLGALERRAHQLGLCVAGHGEVASRSMHRSIPQHSTKTTMMTPGRRRPLVELSGCLGLVLCVPMGLGLWAVVVWCVVRFFGS